MHFFFFNKHLFFLQLGSLLVVFHHACWSNGCFLMTHEALKVPALDPGLLVLKVFLSHLPLPLKESCGLLSPLHQKLISVSQVSARRQTLQQCKITGRFAIYFLVLKISVLWDKWTLFAYLFIHWSHGWNIMNWKYRSNRVLIQMFTT